MSFPIGLDQLLIGFPIGLNEEAVPTPLHLQPEAVAQVDTVPGPSLDEEAAFLPTKVLVHNLSLTILTPGGKKEKCWFKLH